MAAAALILAATMSFGLAACADNADTTGSGGGQNQEETGGGQDTVNKKLTEAEWKTAIASYDTSDNYDQLVDIYTVNGEQKQKIMHQETKRDGNVVVNLNQTTGSPATYACYVLKGEDVAVYNSSDGESWNSATLNDGEKQGILRIFGRDGFTEALYRTKAETEGAGKTIANMYSAFEYDESEGCYTAELNQLGESSVNACTLKIYAENGKLAKIYILGYVTSDDVPMCSETTMTFGGVELEEPTPVKTTLTEEEWKAEIAKYSTADNYASIQEVYSTSPETKMGHMEAKYDGNMVFLSNEMMGGDAQYTFYVLTNDDITGYYRSTDGTTWTSETLTEEQKPDALGEINTHRVKQLAVGQFAVLDDNDEVIDNSANTLENLYSAFEYDESEGCYKARLIQADGDTVFEFSIYAEGGKIIKQVVNSIMYMEGNPFMRLETTTTFGGVELELPQVGE